MITKQSYAPNPLLSKYIDRFYTFEKTGAIEFELPPILPGTGLEVLFYTNTPVLSIQKTRLSRAHIVCPRTLSYFDQTTQVSFLAVRFKSGAFRHFTSIPFSELNNNYLSVQDIWGIHGKELVDRLEDLQEIKDKIKAIEKFLLHYLTLYKSIENEKWDAIIHDLYYNFNNGSIEEFSKNANLSFRQFERKFKFQFGITPKKFQRITRFQDTTKRILLSQNSNYLDVALDNGYFDQSHFIKDFKSFAKQKPITYFKQENTDRHFYYKSINSYS